MKRGTTVHSMEVKLLMKFKLPIPSLGEQNIIEEILSKVDSKMANLDYKKTSLRSLKKGLMQKLLTGQIRVEV